MVKIKVCSNTNTKIDDNPARFRMIDRRAIGSPIDADDLGVFPDHDDEWPKHGHRLGSAEHAAVVIDHGDLPVGWGHDEDTIAVDMEKN